MKQSRGSDQLQTYMTDIQDDMKIHPKFPQTDGKQKTALGSKDSPHQNQDVNSAVMLGRPRKPDV